MTLSLYREIRVTENQYSGIFYALHSSSGIIKDASISKGFVEHPIGILNSLNIFEILLNQTIR